MLHPTVRLLDNRRESFDRRLMVRLVAERRMPVFGIGAGMQLINVSQGRQPAAAHPRGPAARHCRTTTRSTPNATDTAWQSLPARSWIASTATAKFASTACTTWPIDEVAPGFAVTARCPDGVVEAIESNMPRLVRLRHAVPSRSVDRLGARHADLRRIHHRRDE